MQIYKYNSKEFNQCILVEYDGLFYDILCKDSSGKEVKRPAPYIHSMLKLRKASEKDLKNNKLRIDSVLADEVAESHVEEQENEHERYVEEFYSVRGYISRFINNVRNNLFIVAMLGVPYGILFGMFVILSMFL